MDLINAIISGMFLFLVVLLSLVVFFDATAEGGELQGALSGLVLGVSSVCLLFWILFSYGVI